MAAIFVDVEVGDPYGDRLDASCLQQIATDVLAAERPNQSFAVEVVVADDQFLRELNSRYRGMDEATDVLSFSQMEEVASAEDTPVGFVLPPELVTQLGEIVISFPTAEQQAAQASHSVEREITILLVHGLLHLLGYDHAEPDEEARMFARQEELATTAMGCWGER